MNFTHLIYIPFRGVGIKNGDDDWFKERIEIFKQYTLKSLLNQTNKEFHVIFSFRPEDKDSPIVEELSVYLKNKIRCNFVFSGLMYWDDKNLEANKTLEKRLEETLAYLWTRTKHMEPQPNYILMTRLDSDDMLHKDAVEEIQIEFKRNCPPSFPVWDDPRMDNEMPKALVFLRGLVYNTDTKELAEWRPRTNPPFHTIIFPKDVFFDAKKHVEYYGDWQSHEDTILVWPFAKLSDYKYCVTVRNPKNHISTTWQHAFRGKRMDKELLKDFGI